MPDLLTNHSVPRSFWFWESPTVQSGRKEFVHCDHEYLILVAEKNGKYFVIYDGWKVGPDFEEIVIAYCCEPVVWSVQYGQGKYLFWGSRDGQWYVVEIALREN